MAILFYEGLPRSGKSYEAMSTLVIPWLKKGREVVAYIEGLDTEACQARIAEAADIPLEQVKALLFPLTREDMRPREVKRKGKMVTIDGTWIEKTRDNALHVFDEAQSWWGNRTKATEELTLFVSEHGHRGMTVLLMGQSLLDVLALWRRRVDQKFTFLKLSALGQDKRYRVTIYKGQGNGEFVKVTDNINKYDVKYFGTYKSHNSEEIDTETYTDNRAVFWKSSGFQYGAMIAVFCLVWGGWKAYSFFKPPTPTAVAHAPGSSAKAPPTSGVAPPSAQTAPVKAQVPAAEKTPQERYFDDLTSKYRIRLSGLLVGRGHTAGVVEWIDGNTRVVERQTLDTLRDLGVAVVVTGPTVRLQVGEWSSMATMWPMEGELRVSDARQDQIRAESGRTGADQADQAAIRPAGLTLIDNGVKRQPAAPLETQGGNNGFQPRVKAGSPWSFQTQ